MENNPFSHYSFTLHTAAANQRDATLFLCVTTFALFDCLIFGENFNFHGFFT